MPESPHTPRSDAATPPLSMLNARSGPSAESPEPLQELMTAYQQGSLEAFTQLYLRMRDQLAGLLRGLVDDDRVVDELIEQTFLLAHRARHTYVAPQPVTNWLYAIACHVAQRHERSRRSRSTR